MLRIALLSIASLSLAGCGAISDFINPAQTIELRSIPTESGYVTSSGTATLSTVTYPYVGDSTIDSTARAVFCFNLAAIPAGAEIEEAILFVGQETVLGTPYAQLGNVQVDHVNIGAALNAADYNLGTLDSGIGTLSTNILLEEKAVNVTGAVQDDVDNGRNSSDFRLRFDLTTNSDGGADNVRFNNDSDGGGSGNIPLLQITFRP